MHTDMSNSCCGQLLMLPKLAGPSTKEADQKSKYSQSNVVRLNMNPIYAVAHIGPNQMGMLKKNGL